MRRKPGTLLPLERAVCVAAIDLAESGVAEFHGYDLARHLADIEERRLLIAYGTLYRTLGRLERMGLLASHWEDPAIPARENRPGRRLYTMTGAGEDAARDARMQGALRAQGSSFQSEQGSLTRAGLLAPLGAGGSLREQATGSERSEEPRAREPRSGELLRSHNRDAETDERPPRAGIGGAAHGSAD